MSFRYYRLIRLNAATGDENVETMCDYNVTIIDNFGRRKDMSVKLGQIERDWCKLRMLGDRFAKFAGGECLPISEDEFNKLAS